MQIFRVLNTTQSFQQAFCINLEKFEFKTRKRAIIACRPPRIAVSV